MTEAFERDPVLHAHVDPDERAFELGLRPKRMSEFIGQAKLKDQLGVFIKAAIKRGEPLDHVLLHGPPGLGKTTLAHVIAGELETPIRVTSGPALERAGDLAAILTNLSPGEVLFVDEIHRLPNTVEEVLYPAMEDFTLDLIVGQGPSARTVRLDVPRFTLVGATTRASLLSSPLRSRFGINHRLDFYAHSELTSILKRSSSLLSIPIEEEGASELAGRARGTPRIANWLLRRVRDFAEIEGEGLITRQSAAAALDRLEVDELGLVDLDRRILKTIITLFDGGPVGLGTLAASIAEDRGAVEEIYEPYLLQQGLIQRTPRGRVATAEAYRHLGLDPEQAERSHPVRLRELTLTPWMDTSLLDYPLPDDRIAQHPLPERDAARLLVVDRADGGITHSRVLELPNLLRRDDLLVRNRSRVIPARIHALRADTGGRVELLFLNRHTHFSWRALVRPARRLRPGQTLSIPGGLELQISSTDPGGIIELQVPSTPALLEVLDRFGEPPLPPYIHRTSPEPGDVARYQTTYATESGSAAAPTAGLHFSERLLSRVCGAGVELCDVLLHIGLGTFQPIRTATLEEHRIHEESYELSDSAAQRLLSARTDNRRVVAIGTTSVRVLESAWDGERFRSGRASTSLYLKPGSSFEVTDALITNFHAPRSSLLALVMAFAGVELIRNAYEAALAAEYRFLSYGDAMLIL